MDGGLQLAGCAMVQVASPQQLCRLERCRRTDPAGGGFQHCTGSRIQVA